MSTAGSDRSSERPGAGPSGATSLPAAAQQPPGRKKVRIFRWQGTIPLLLVFALLVTIWILFGDRIVEETTEEASTELLGTQVDIAALRIRETEPSVEIRGVQVADPFNPMRNLVEAGRIQLELEAVPLLEKKLVIRQLALLDLRFGTQRSRPAKPAQGDGYAAQTLRDVRQWAGQFDVPLLKLTPIDTIRSIVLDPTQLTTVREALALRTRADSTRAALRQQYEGLRLQETLDSARSVAKRLEGANPVKLGIDGTRRAIEDVKRTINQINETRRRVEALEQSARGGLDALGAGVRGVDEARRKDYAFARGLLKLPTFEGPEIGKALFGTVSIDRFQQAVYWAELAQKYMPPGLRPRPAPGPKRLRAAGTTVQFPKEQEYPPFLLRHGDLSFAVGGEGMAAGRYSGSISNLTTAPDLVGRPTVFTAQRSAQSAGMGSVRVSGMLDHRGGRPRDSVAVSVADFKLPSFALPGLPFRLDPNVGAMGFRFARDGDRLAGRWTISSNQVSWLGDSARVRKPNPVEAIVYRVITGLRKLDLTAELSGTFRSPNLSVRSTLDRAIAERLRAVAGEELKKAEARARAEVDRVVGPRVEAAKTQVAAVRSEADRRVAEAKARLDEEKKRLEERLQALTKGVIPLPRLPGE